MSIHVAVSIPSQPWPRQPRATIADNNPFLLHFAVLSVLNIAVEVAYAVEEVGCLQVALDGQQEWLSDLNEEGRN